MSNIRFCLPATSWRYFHRPKVATAFCGGGIRVVNFLGSSLSYLLPSPTLRLLRTNPPMSDLARIHRGSSLCCRRCRPMFACRICLRSPSRPMLPLHTSASFARRKMASAFRRQYQRRKRHAALPTTNMYVSCQVCSCDTLRFVCVDKLYICARHGFTYRVALNIMQGLYPRQEADKTSVASFTRVISNVKFRTSAIDRLAI